ncbi:MAG: serine/threonine protein kinase [Phycisphaerales bacterium]
MAHAGDPVVSLTIMAETPNEPPQTPNPQGTALPASPASASDAGPTGSLHLFKAQPGQAPSPNFGPSKHHHTERPGDHIGPYKLLELLGEGGFGTVWAAEQTHPLKRRVALKLLNPGMDTKTVLARFEQERQALAMMDHTNIARVLDAGATESGRPYFVMELVRGVPITQFCDKAKLTPRQRMELMQQVARAVQHAHTKGIIHRDIKPGNVLVTLHGDTPVPKVIDFGIAKATTQPLTDKTIYTEFRQLIGTPPYMSPEQAEMSGLDIDTRTDIYALGALTYELLTGSPPLDPEELRRAGIAEVYRLIKESEPPKPSTKVTFRGAGVGSRMSGVGGRESGGGDGEEQTRAIAAKRGCEPGKLAALLKGEPDWIVMKAMEKDRTRRYETADGLAADIGRYLSGEAVLAGPPSVAYRVKRFVRRHRVGVGVGGVVLAALMVAVGGVWWGIGAEQKATARVKAERDLILERFTGAMRHSVEASIAAGDERLKAGIIYQDRDALLRATVGSKGAVEIQFAAIDQDGTTSEASIDQISRMVSAHIILTVDRIVAGSAALREANESLSEEVKRARLAEARNIFLTSGSEWEHWNPELDRSLAVYDELLGPSHIETLEALCLGLRFREAASRLAQQPIEWNIFTLNMHTLAAKEALHEGFVDEAIRLYNLARTNVRQHGATPRSESLSVLFSDSIDSIDMANRLVVPHEELNGFRGSSFFSLSETPESSFDERWPVPDADAIRKRVLLGLVVDAATAVMNPDHDSNDFYYPPRRGRFEEIATRVAAGDHAMMPLYWQVSVAIHVAKRDYIGARDEARFRMQLDPTPDPADLAMLSMALNSLGERDAACETLETMMAMVGMTYETMTLGVDAFSRKSDGTKWEWYVKLWTSLARDQVAP